MSGLVRPPGPLDVWAKARWIKEPRAQLGAAPSKANATAATLLAYDGDAYRSSHAPGLQIFTGPRSLKVAPSLLQGPPLPFTVFLPNPGALNLNDTIGERGDWPNQTIDDPDMDGAFELAGHLTMVAMIATLDRMIGDLGSDLRPRYEEVRDEAVAGSAEVGQGEPDWILDELATIMHDQGSKRLNLYSEAVRYRFKMQTALDEDLQALLL